MARKRHNVKRTASGRRSRAADSYVENIAGIQARMMRYGLSEANARDQKAATVLGRLQLSRTISQAQYEAGTTYLAAYGAYQRALKSPDALRTSTGAASRAEDSDEYARWCRGAIKRFEDAEKAITREQCFYRGSNLHAAIDYIVRRDQDFEHLYADCAIALDALVRHFGLVGGSREPVDNFREAAA